MFEQENAAVMHDAVETRYPFLDLRVVKYLLSLPMFPWFFQKMLLREAMAGRLTERVRTRPKTPLLGDALLTPLPRMKTQRLSQNPLCSTFDQFNNRLRP